MWLNFTRYGVDDMYLFYPVVLIALTGFILFLPAPILYHRSRSWFLYSNVSVQLNISVYTANSAVVEAIFLWVVSRRVPRFLLGRHVLLSDICNGGRIPTPNILITKPNILQNIALFFCLYAQEWNDPTQCNSSHSRLLGFFSALPGIWRALQCIRRYYDTRNIFPHLVNCGKYTWTILYYMSLSLYRVHKVHQLRAFFIFCATINSVYCSRCENFQTNNCADVGTGIWDLVMDWSMLPSRQLSLLRSLTLPRSCRPNCETPFSAREPGFQTNMDVLRRHGH